VSARLLRAIPEETLIDKDGKEHHLLNQNVLTEIGGAMALWDDNFVLLVEEGAKLPSNLQGLYEVRYTGDALDHEATMKLLRTFKQFKS
jgi:predicted nucleotide-binding protein